MHALGRVSITLLLVAAIATPLGAQTPASDALEVTISGYGQFQFNTTSVDDDDVGGNVASSVFETRRVRLYADVRMGGWLEGRIQPEWAMGRFSLADVYMNFVVDPRLQVRMGQFKLPFNRFYLNPSTAIMTIERGIRIREFDRALARELGSGENPFTVVDGKSIHGDEHAILNAMGLVGRDIGVAVHGKARRFGYELAVFNGNGQDALDTNDGKSFMTRVAYSPIDGAPLTLGAAASYREFRFDGTIDGVAVEPGDRSGTAFGFDLEWGRYGANGFHVLAGITTGENLYVDARILGAQGMIGYLVPLRGSRIQAIEVLGRASYGDPNTSRSGDHGILLTPGVNLYLGGRNRLLVNWDVYAPADSRLSTHHALRVQTQFVFGVPVGPRTTVAASD